MRQFLLLWLLQIVSVTSLKIASYKVREFSKPKKGGPKFRMSAVEEANDGEYPFLIFALFNSPEEKLTYCTASLLSSDLAMTAAHCMFFPSLQPHDIILVGGRANLDDYAAERFEMDWNDRIDEDKLEVQERRAKSYYVHPNYIVTDEGIAHDICLIKAEYPFTGYYDRPIALAFDKLKKKKICTVVGWGPNENSENYRVGVVRQTEISTTTIGCELEHSMSLICVRSDEMPGVSSMGAGSPVVCDGMVSGFSLYAVTDDSAGEEVSEEYYAEIAAEKDWIQPMLSAGIVSVQISLSQVFVCAIASLWMSPPRR